MDDTRTPLTLAIVEDSSDLRENLELFLSSLGYAVWGVGSAEACYKALLSRRADILLVDLALPGESGESLIKLIAPAADRAVVVISARGEVSERCRLLCAGADAYLVKPFDLNELAAVVHALARRLRLAGPGALPSRAGRSWCLRPGSAELMAPCGAPIRLSSSEYALVECLMRRAGEVVSKAELLAELFPHEPEAVFHRVEVILNRLRQKLRQQGLALPVRSVFGKGLVFSEGAVTATPGA